MVEVSVGSELEIRADPDILLDLGHFLEFRMGHGGTQKERTGEIWRGGRRIGRS